MHDLAARLANRVQLTTDGHRVYLEAVESALNEDVDYAMLAKIYHSNLPETRYSLAECVGTETKIISGTPNPKHVLRGAPPHDANVHAPVHAPDERIEHVQDAPPAVPKRDPF